MGSGKTAEEVLRSDITWLILPSYIERSSGKLSRSLSAYLFVSLVLS